MIDILLKPPQPLMGLFLMIPVILFRILYVSHIAHVSVSSTIGVVLYSGE